MTSSTLDDRKESAQVSTYTSYQGATITINPPSAERIKKIFAETAWYASPQVNDLLHQIIVSPETCVSTERIFFQTSPTGGYATQQAVVQHLVEAGADLSLTYRLYYVGEEEFEELDILALAKIVASSSPIVQYLEKVMKKGAPKADECKK